MPVSGTALTVRPVLVVTALIVSMMTSWEISGRPRQFMVIAENSRCSIRFHLLVPGQCRCLSAANYRGVECEHLGGHPAGRTANLACLAEGVLRGRALEEPVGLPQTPDAVVELAADLRGHRRHELLDLHGCLCALTDDAAPHVLEDLDEGDAVRVDPLLAGQPHDDPGQAVVHRQVRPYLLADQFGVR